EETDIARIKTGQPVDITVDSYPGQVFHGHVAMVGAVSGAQFSLLPQNNAEGNYTKVVQRIPVRIQFDQPSDLLKPGMSVEVDIRAHG
ncbi:MAG: HlyD family secretion protein, partial [Cyanobacteria bacterium REEB65]|nr:HlyD family secretion protein [Cyanobacteria bacterium REEB65]